VGVELGIGESILIKAIGESTGRSLSLIKADLKRDGDLGLVAMVLAIFCIPSVFLFTQLTELQKQSEDIIQAQTFDGTFRVLPFTRYCPFFWPFCE
jgi:hypothetical protein